MFPKPTKSLFASAVTVAAAVIPVVAGAGAERATHAGSTLADQSKHEAGTGVPAPAGMNVRLDVHQGPGGVLLRVETRKFMFAPARMAPDHEQPWPHTPGEGHMHLYVDAKSKPKTLIVAPWTYVALRPGRHRLRVTLNANTHAEYMRNGKPIQDAKTFDVKG